MILAYWVDETLFPILRAILPVALWAAFWLFAVNWKKAWAVLREGAWAPGVLLILITAIVWSRIFPGPFSFMGGLTLPSFWGQLVAVSGLAGIALFAGWLQGVWGYSPPEIAVEPPAHAGHGHH